MIKSIGILTSGGDAPGMNNAVRSIVKTCFKNDIKPYLIYEGYKGLVEGNIEEATLTSVSRISNIGGTILGSARLPEFKEESVRKKAVKNFNEKGIDALIVIGGDGSYMGAAKLTEMGIPCVGLPGTIDNDIACTDWTIGFDTALTMVVEAIDRVKVTANSHSRCMIIETMGRHCGDLAIFGALAGGVEVISVPEKKLSETEIIEQVAAARNKDNKREIIVLVTEHLYDVSKLAIKIEKETKIITRELVLANLQRGGTPTAKDRVLGTIMGVFAVEELIANKKGIAVCEVNNKLVSKDILEAIKEKAPSRLKEIEAVKKTS